MKRRHNEGYGTLVHPIEPVYDERSEILIMGSFPSVRSREVNFFYGHPQNRFWKLMERIYETGPLLNVEDKKAFLHGHHIALWDVIRSCRISGSSDASICDVTVNDLHRILDHSPIRKIYVNGKTAEKMYRRYTMKLIGIECSVLPSTSPANAAWSMEKLFEVWKQIKDG
ncbi:MAG: DNA-deoxyinosine glycosylase [Erysipelotrichaceae bacterium]|nr:DNA-deoxyinosine glycosylase [Erysipelotrichaceae bacterium]